MSKGKKRIGFEYKINVKYDINGSIGTIKFDEVTDYSEGKFEVMLT